MVASMRTTTCSCDRCGHVVVNSSLLHEVSIKDHWRTLGNDWHYVTVELCPDCKEKLKGWLKA